MPTILFHLKVANEYVKKNNEYDTNSFYLGIIAPDAVNAYGFASKEKRWGAHIRDKDLNKWKDNVIEFYKENIKIVEENIIPVYECNCNKEKFERGIISLGKKEIENIIQEQGNAEVVCQFCNRKYNFSREELKEMLLKLEQIGKP